MPQYKSFRKKNRYKTLKYSHKNKRKNSHKNKYRVGNGPIMRFFKSRGLRARIHNVPDPGGPPPRQAEPIDDVGEEEAPPEVPPPPEAPPLPLPLRVLDIEREKKIQRLLRLTTKLLFKIQLVPSTIFDNIEVHNPNTMTSHHINYARDGGLLTYTSVLNNAQLLMRQLESPDIINDPRIINARSDIKTYLRIISDRAETIGRSIVNDSIPPRRIIDSSFY